MRTSKIIFISLLGSIAIVILAAFIDLRITGTRNGIDGPGLSMTKQSIPSFKVLYVTGINIELSQNDSSFVEVRLFRNNLSPKLNYRVKEDTLIVSAIDSIRHNNNMAIGIHSTATLNSIFLKNSNIIVQRFVSGKMSLDMDESIAWFNQDKSSFNTLEIVAKNHSQINTSGFKVDSLGVFLQNSYASFEIASKKLYGSISDSSTLYAGKAEVISLKRDSTSKINLND